MTQISQMGFIVCTLRAKLTKNYLPRRATESLKKLGDFSWLS